MKRWGWIFSAVVLLAITASAQQAAAPASQPANSQPAVQPVSTTPGLALAPQTARTPVSVDQVVDAIIEREHALIQFLHDRTPLVETYLQNLQLLHYAYSAINPVAIKSLMKAVGLPSGELRKPLTGLEGEPLLRGLRVIKELELDRKYGWSSPMLKAV